MTEIDNLWNLFDNVKKCNLENNKLDDEHEDLKNNKLDDEKKDSSNISQKLIAIDLCKFCNTNSLEYDSGIYYCNICGIFQQKRLSENAEYRFYGEIDNKNSNPERVGMPTNILLPKSSLGSLIGYRKYDNLNFKKMIQYNSWNAMPYKERSQWKVFSKIATKCKAGGLPKIIIEDAKGFYKIISETSISRGNNRQGIIASCVYMACKKHTVPRSSKEIASIFGIKLHDMTRGCKKFKEIWRLSKQNIKIKIKTANPLDYIDRFCSNLRLPRNIKFIAEFVAVKAISCLDNLVSDNTAPSVAAGSIFLVCTECKQNTTKKLVSKACKTSEVTISKCYKKLYNHKLDLFPSQVIDKFNIHN